VFPAAVPRVIVAGDDHVYGMSRMLAAPTDPLRSDVQVVRKMSEAYEVLKMKLPQFQTFAGKEKKTAT